MMVLKVRVGVILVIAILIMSAGCQQAGRERGAQHESPAATAVTAAAGPAPGTVAIPVAEYRAGYTVLTFNYTDSTGKPKSLTTAVWYPTDASASAHSYGRGTPDGMVASGGKPSVKGPFPLVVFSHGYGGCGLQSVFFTEELARHGYVVAAPDHNDARMCSILRGDRTGTTEEFDLRQFADPGSFSDASYTDRRDDIRAVIDGMLRQNGQDGSLLHGTIDPAKIGMSGHSLGGYTTMGLIGGWDSWRDPRIIAALMLSPYVQPYADHGNIGKILIPVMYQGGTADYGITPAIRRAGGAYDKSNPPKYFLDIRGANHMDWSNLVCKGYDSVPACLDSDEMARVIDAYGIAFLDRYLNGKAAGSVLKEQDPVLDGYRYQE